MIYYDFIIRKEHKRLGNIFEKEELEQWKNLQTWTAYTFG